MGRTKLEGARESMEMKDPIWSLYEHTGKTLEEVLENKPKLQIGKSLLWTKYHGWEVIHGGPELCPRCRSTKEKEDTLQGDKGSD